MEKFMENKDFGTIQINLEKLMKERGLNKTKLSYMSELTRVQITKLCRNQSQRFDAGTLARLCYALNCSLSELIEYIPPENR